MNHVINDLKIGFAAIGGVLGWAFGGFDSLIYALIAFVVIDYITGVLVAIRNKKLSSEIGFKGICKKVMIFLLVAVGNLIDQHLLSTGSTVRTMVIMFYLSNEGISIMENAESLGLPLPKKLKAVIEQISGEDNGDETGSYQNKKRR